MENLTVISENKDSTVVSVYEVAESSEATYETENQLEEKFMGILQGQGYERVRFASNEEMVANLRKLLERLNEYCFTDKEWKRFFDTVIANDNLGILDKANSIQRDYRKTFRLDNGVDKNFILIDKDNVHKNYLQVMNQYAQEGIYKNIYDVTVLVNGLPLVHIELKRRGVNIKEAFNQIERYKRESFFSNSGLFEYVQIFVISNGTETKYYSNTVRDNHVRGNVKKKGNSFEFTNYWSDAKNNKILDLIDFGKTFFAKHTILNVLTKYCVFTTDDLLLVMRPYQIAATERLLNRVKGAQSYKKYKTKEAGGYIWHTTGSGKTLTSFKAAQLCKEIDGIEKVLFVVDRKDLDYQTMKEYENFQKGAANSNTNTSVLARQMGDFSVDSKIIITTIQKLSRFVKKNKVHPVYNKEVVIIFDECHRSQFGTMHKNITRAFNKYYIFGFTGTPITAVNRSSEDSIETTKHIFGDVLHTYTIQNAISDKNVLPFRYHFYTTTQLGSDLKDYGVEAIDKAGALKDINRIRLIASNIILKFSALTKRDVSYNFNSITNVEEVAKNRPNKGIDKSSIIDKKYVKGFNSILACDSIESVKKYYTAFKEINHDLNIATIFSYAPNEEAPDSSKMFSDGLYEENNESIGELLKPDRDFLESAICDYNEMFNTSYDTSSEKFQNYYKDVSLRMKNKEIDILIVVNMFLTGFDAKTLNTLWVDKNLKYHGLVQAFSRTNRILNSVKTHGNIVCFRDMESDLNNALKLFGDENAKETVLIRPYNEYYYGYTDNEGEDFAGYKNLVESLLVDFPINEEIVGNASKKDFVKLYGAVLKVMNILSYFPEFDKEKILTDRAMQNYQSRYLSIRDEFRNYEKAEQENIIGDLVFEIELVKSFDVDVDYILKQIADNMNNLEDSEVKLSVMNAVDSSTALRSKKDLIERFIEELNGRVGDLDINYEFGVFSKRERILELNKIIEEENLKKAETYKFIRNSFKNGEVVVIGDNITKIMPPMSPFAKNVNYKEKKEDIISKIQAFFERFFNISSEEFEVEETDFVNY